MRGILAIVAVLGCIGVCRADTVVLTSGLTIDGVVRDLGKQIEVKVPEGTFFYRKDAVKEIRKGQSSLEWYAQRKASVRVGDVAAHLALANECAARKMKNQAEEQYRQVLGQSPDNEVARTALGYEKVDGKWLLESDAMQAKGYVRIDGKWVDPAQAALLTAERTAAAQVRAAEYQRQVLLQQAEAEKRAIAAKEEAAALAKRREKELKDAQEAAIRREREQRFSYCRKCSAKVFYGDKNCSNCHTRVY